MAASKSKAAADLRKEALARYTETDDYWKENRRRWVEDTRFCIPGNQWPERIRKLREDQNRPCLEVDKINQYVHQVVNDGRQNRPAVKVRPVDDGADEEAADAFQGLIRSIFDRSNGDEALDTALEHAVRGGFGFIRIITEYASDKSFNQDISILRVRNPLTILLGPHQKADGSDAKFGFVIDEMSKDEFKKKYPKAEMSDWSSYPEGWTSKDMVRVCEYFYVIDKEKNVLLLDDDTTCTEDEYWEQAKNNPDAPRPKIVEQRMIPECEVKWCRMSGAEILEENDWLGKYIPIIPLYGNEIDLEGKVILHGLVRPAKDAQTLYNFSRSGFAERVALANKAPWIAPAEAVADFKDDWENSNTKNLAVLRFRAFMEDGTPIPMPQRGPSADIPAGFMQDMTLSEHDIQASMGMYNASLGEKSNEKSGVAITARQRKGDTATFHYQDNQNRAVRYIGRQLVDLAPKIYDSKRTLRILGEDGTGSTVQVDPEMKKASHKQGALAIYNLGVGTYDVSVAAGPSYSTKRQESAQAMIELTQANPGMWQTHGDLIVKSQDWPGAEEFAERSKLTLPPPIQQAIAAKEQGGEVDPEKQQIIDQANHIMGMAQQRIQAAEDGIHQRDQALAEKDQEIAALKQGQAVKAADVNVKAAQAETQQFEAETQRMTALAPAMDENAIAAIVAKTVQEIMRQPAPMVQ